MQRSTGKAGRETAYAYLRNLLLTDHSLTGTFLAEQAIAEQLGISRTPVREALLMLAAEDLVQLVPNRGAFIAPVTGEQMAHIMQARGVIETWAARQCLAHGDVPVDTMASWLDQQREIADTGTAVEFIDLDRNFHCTMVEAAGNPVLAQMYESLRARHVLLGVLALERSVPRKQEVLAEHQRILDALVAQDYPAAEAAILEHIGTTHSVLVAGPSL